MDLQTSENKLDLNVRIRKSEDDFKNNRTISNEDLVSKYNEFNSNPDLRSKPKKKNKSY
jgi:hypothetical protein